MTEPRRKTTPSDERRPDQAPLGNGRCGRWDVLIVFRMSTHRADVLPRRAVQNARRNDPSVDGTYAAAAKTVPIPPCRSSAMSSMLSAPATMPATGEDHL
jgi:hypothetical protein